MEGLSRWLSACRKDRLLRGRRVERGWRSLLGKQKEILPRRRAPGKKIVTSMTQKVVVQELLRLVLSYKMS